MRYSIVLCSGGLDSVTAAHLVRKKYPYSKIDVIFFNYRQRQLRMERNFSKKCAENISAKWIEVLIPDIKPLYPGKKTKKGLKNTKDESDNWYIPFRNTMFLSYALSYAERIAVKNKIKKISIYTGFKCEGKEPYPDTTKKYIHAINRLSKTAAPKFDILVNAPLITKDKEDIISLGNKLNVDYKKTYSCYIGRSRHCGICLACRLRKAGFYWAGAKDPSEYSRN